MEDYIRLLAKQQSLSGGTSLISMYIPPNGRVSLSKQLNWALSQILSQKSYKSTQRPLLNLLYSN